MTAELLGGHTAQTGATRDPHCHIQGPSDGERRFISSHSHIKVNSVFPKCFHVWSPRPRNLCDICPLFSGCRRVVVVCKDRMFWCLELISAPTAHCICICTLPLSLSFPSSLFHSTKEPQQHLHNHVERWRTQFSPSCLSTISRQQSIHLQPSSLLPSLFYPFSRWILLLVITYRPPGHYRWTKTVLNISNRQAESIWDRNVF